MIKHIIRNFNNGVYEEINESEYTNISNNNYVLLECISKESIYNIVLMNYYEFEKALFDISLKDQVIDGRGKIRGVMNLYKMTIDQKLLNLLSSATLYLDSFKEEKGVDKFHDILKNEFADINEKIQKFYSENLSFKLMRFFRNHIQHNGLLLDEFGLKSDFEHNSNILSLSLHKKKKEVKARGYCLEDFSDFPDDVNLKESIREYVDLISVLHEHFRAGSFAKIQQAKEYLDSLFDQYDEKQYLQVIVQSDSQKISELTMYKGRDELRQELVAKNSVPTNFHNQYISTKF